MRCCWARFRRSQSAVGSNKWSRKGSAYARSPAGPEPLAAAPESRHGRRGPHPNCNIEIPIEGAQHDRAIAKPVHKNVVLPSARVVMEPIVFMINSSRCSQGTREGGLTECVAMLPDMRVRQVTQKAARTKV